MFNKRLLIFLFIIPIASSIFAQKNDLALSNLILEEDSIAFIKENIQTTNTKLNKGAGSLDNIENIPDELTLINQYIDEGSEHVRYGNTDSLYIILQHLSHLIQDNSPNADILYSYYYLNAKYYGIKADFINELDYWLKLKSILKPTALDDLLMANQAISIIYFRLLDFESSLKIFKDNLKIAEKTGDDLSLLFTYFGVADCYMQLDKHAKAKEICFKAIRLKKNTEVSESFGFIYSLLGYIYMEESRIDSAEYYLNKGIIISQNQNEPKELYDNYNAMVSLQLLKGDTIKAQFYAKKSIVNTLFHEPRLYKNLAEIYSHQNEYSKANEALQKNIKYYEDLNNKNSLFTLASSLLENRFEQERKIQIAESKQKFQDTKSQIILVASILLLLLFSIIIFIQIFYRRKSQKINEGLIEKNEYLEQFAYICSHDLKEPIRNIGSFASLIQNKLEKEDLKLNYDEYFQIINGGTAMLSQTVDSLKIFTDLNQYEAVDKSKISLISVVNDTIQSLDHLIQENKVTISINNEIDNQEIYSFEYGIHLILMNIIHNAIKFNQSEKRIVDISIKKLNSNILITVEDNGPGISEEYSKQIFLPFKTLKNKVVTKSSGLGLTICTKVINIIGGKICLESELGKGSKFHILINQ